MRNASELLEMKSFVKLLNYFHIVKYTFKVYMFKHMNVVKLCYEITIIY